MSSLDYTIIAAYILLLAGVAAAASSKIKGIEDYFFAGHNLPTWSIVPSIIAAETTVLTIVSVPGMAFDGNLTFMQLAMGYFVGRVLIAFALSKGYLAHRFTTVYQYLGDRFDNRVQIGSSCFFLVSRTLAEAVRVYAVAVILSSIVGGPMALWTTAIVGMTLVYTLVSGFRAVIWTDIVQVVVYLIGGIATIYISTAALPQGISDVLRIGSEYKKFVVFDFSLTMHTPFSLWSGVIGGAFITLYSHGSDQLISQRLLATHGTRQAQIAIIVSGFIVDLQFLFFLLVGVGLFCYYKVKGGLPPNISGDATFPYFMGTDLPTGVKGAMVAAVIGATMGNLSAALNALASSLVVDVAMPLLPFQINKKSGLVRLSRIAVIALGCAVTVIALAVSQTRGSAVATAGTLVAIPSGSLLGVVMLAFLTRVQNVPSLIIGVIIGMIISSLLVMGVLPFQIAWPWFIMISSLTTLLASMTLSRLHAWYEGK